MLRHIIEVTCSVKLGLTATFALRAIENLIDVHAFSATLVFVSAYRAQTHFGPGGLGMEATITHFSDRVVVLAAIAADQVEVGPDFPVNFLPRDAVGLSDESYELL